MDVGVLGLGHLGSVTAACLAQLGHRVVGMDFDEARVANLSMGIAPIFEPGLEELVRRNTGEGRLSFTIDAEDAISQSMVSFIAVGTPMSKDGAANLSGVMKAAETIAKAVTGYHIICVKSTVPVGTNTQICARLRERTGRDCDVASNVAGFSC